jgi:hypothetical protein
MPGRRDRQRYCFGAGLFEPAEELPGAVVLPLGGEVALPPAEGEVLGVAGRVVAVEPLLPDELFLLEPELSQAASESTESTAAAVNHVRFIYHSMMSAHEPKPRPCCVTAHGDNRGRRQKSPLSVFSHSSPQLM